MSSQTPKYLSMYGFKLAPFRLSPDPFFFFPSPTHMAAEKILRHAITNGEGFMVLSGKAGLGKTLLLRRLLKSLDENKLPILILSPTISPIGLLQLLLGEIGISYDKGDSQALLLQLFQNYVLKMAEKSKELFIIVDEAQNMPIKTLEQLRMLSNLETGTKKLMQILLIGQNELEEILSDSRLGQLEQRIVVHEKLEPLARGQISRYVSFRLNKAGRGDIRLSKGGCKLLHNKSQGIPRLINRIMDRTLLLASVEKATTLSTKHVKAAVNTMKDLQPTRFKKLRRNLTVAVCAGALILLVTLFFLNSTYWTERATGFLDHPKESSLQKTTHVQISQLATAGHFQQNEDK